MVLLKENWRFFFFCNANQRSSHSILQNKATAVLPVLKLSWRYCISCKKEETLISRNQDSVKSHNLWHFSHELSLRARLRGLSRSQKSCDLQSLTLYTPKWAIIGCPFFTLQFAPMISLHTGQKYKFKNGNLKMPATSTKK